jgi:SAM-dependent methyltransferase
VIDPADTRGRKNRLIDRAQKRALARALGDVRGRRILDLGCGTGRIAAWLERKGGVPVGIEPSEAMIRRARALYPDLPLVASVGRLPLRTSGCDAVVMVTVLQYLLEEPGLAEEVVSEVDRVLVPGGALVALEQVTAQPLGRGGDLRAYEEVITTRLDLVGARGVRVAASRVMGASLALPVPVRVAAAGLGVEARHWPSRTEPYAEVVFVARSRRHAR